MNTSSISERLIELKVIPVLRLPSREAAQQAVECLLEAGFRTAELTLTMPDAIALIGELRKRLDASFLIGAGTVLDLDTARACLAAGADYLVSPCLVPGMAKLAQQTGKPALMGGYTPMEVLASWREGSQIVKLFPAGSGGPAHLAALHAVYPKIPLCPTGGVSLANMAEYFKAGATLVGVGNNIIDQKALATGDRAQVIRHARSFLDCAQAACA